MFWPVWESADLRMGQSLDRPASPGIGIPGALASRGIGEIFLEWSVKVGSPMDMRIIYLDQTDMVLMTDASLVLLCESLILTVMLY